MAGSHDDELQCQVCGEALEAPMVWCARCDTPHHRDCWEWNGGCSTYGCKSEETRSDPAEETPGPLIVIDGDEPSPSRPDGLLLTSHTFNRQWRRVIDAALVVGEAFVVTIATLAGNVVGRVGRIVCWPGHYVVEVLKGAHDAVEAMHPYQKRRTSPPAASPSPLAVLSVILDGLILAGLVRLLLDADLAIPEGSALPLGLVAYFVLSPILYPTLDGLATRSIRPVLAGGSRRRPRRLLPGASDRPRRSRRRRSGRSRRS